MTMKEKMFEVNCDGLIGPSHNYAGLAAGNVASQQSRQQISYPKTAALQGLKKMKLLLDMGLKQIVLPPAPRPHMDSLRKMGLSGHDNDLLNQASLRQLGQIYSASNMWTANAATVSPSPDTVDAKLHFTPANLYSNFHRSIEPPFTTKALRMIFAGDDIVVHDPLDSCEELADEGAANQMRLCPRHGESGVEILVYGRSLKQPEKNETSGRQTEKNETSGRQTREAYETISKQHQIDGLLVQQSQEAIKNGVFHNDVIAMSNCNVLIYHEKAFADTDTFISTLKQRYQYDDLSIHEISDNDLSLDRAVQTYLFNSQLITNPEGDLCLILPGECETDANIKKILQDLRDKIASLKHIIFVNVRESMRNGGGPACLRLRVVMSEAQLNSIHQQVIFTEDLYNQLVNWVNNHYRDELPPEALRDPKLMDECQTALKDLALILDLKDLYTTIG